MRKLSRPKSLRETLTDHHKAMDFYADMMGKPRTEKVFDVAPKRERAAPKPSIPSDDTEAPVQKAVNKLLSEHPAIAWACRVNGGAVEIPDGKGGYRPMSFYRFVSLPDEKEDDVKYVLLDNIFQRKDGVFGMIECKRPSWTKPTTQTERNQAATIRMVIAAGGRAGFATSSEQARLIIES